LQPSQLQVDPVAALMLLVLLQQELALNELHAQLIADSCSRH
jgi:hypothetical protein